MANAPRLAIRHAALRLIHRHGFAAMSLRDLAAEVGIRPGSLYNHIATKQSLLFDLMHEHMTTLLAETDAALAAAGPAPLDRLRSFIAHHVLYHLERKREVYIANFELRALDAANAARILAMRHDYEARLIGLLEEGAAAGVLATRRHARHRLCHAGDAHRRLHLVQTLRPARPGGDRRPAYRPRPRWHPALAAQVQGQRRVVGGDGVEAELQPLADRRLVVAAPGADAEAGGA